jgi:3-oxocholest-4-en-26-oyl-CoA dehydrogenase beta subunit
MDFSYTEEQESLRQLAARLLGERFTDELRKQFRHAAEPYDRQLWSALAGAGLLGTALGVQSGGSGLGFTELCLLLEEQGRTLAAVPLLATLVMGALPLQRFGSAVQQALLPRVASGELIMSAALEEPGGGDLMQPRLSARRTLGGWRLSGAKVCVPYGVQAQQLLVSALTAEHGARLFLLGRDTPGVTLAPQVSTSGEPQAQLILTEVELPSAAQVNAADALSFTLQHARVALAAQQLGVVEEALRRAAVYVSERRQFGRPIGSFQAVQHRLADCYIDVEALRSVYLRAVWALDAGRPAAAEVLAAKWWAARAGHRVTHAVQHVHGGMGADVEYPVHAFFLKAKQLEIALGGGGQLQAEIGAALAAGAVPAFTQEVSP